MRQDPWQKSAKTIGPLQPLAAQFFQDPFIMIRGVKVENALQPIDSFCRAPGPAAEAFGIVAKHGAGVV